MMAVDDDALEATLCDHALELRDRGRRIADRQRREAEEPRRWRRTASAIASFVLRANVFASSPASCSTPGAVSDSACTSTPAASIAATRPSPMSRRLSTSVANLPPSAQPAPSAGARGRRGRREWRSALQGRWCALRGFFHRGRRRARRSNRICLPPARDTRARAAANVKAIRDASLAPTRGLCFTATVECSRASETRSGSTAGREAAS